jgi:GTPase
MKSGLVALIGRPNVGKSTLLNALLGQKLAIMSDRPQTTRTVVRGVLHRPEGQAVLLDTPGLHKPKTLLGQRLNDLVRGTLSEVDLICFLVDAHAGIGRGDEFLAGELREISGAHGGRAGGDGAGAPDAGEGGVAGGEGTPVLCVVNKVDATSRGKVVQALDAASKLGDWAEIVPISARTGSQVDLLADLLVQHLPEGPLLYPEGHVTDEPEDHLIAEVIREKALSLVRDELPHSIAVMVDETMQPVAPGKPLTIHATVFVERDSQKGIVVGKGGSVLREIGTRARTELETLLSTRIYLDLHVKVAKEWQRDPKQLARLGF